MNFPSLAQVSSIAPTPLVGNNEREVWSTGSSTNSGGTWTIANAATGAISGLRVGYADGTFDGIPIAISAAALVADGVYSTNESGTKFTSPSGVTLNVRGLAMFQGLKTGSPTGTPRLGLWTGTTPVNQGYATPNSAVLSGGTAQWVNAYFAALVVIPPNTVCRVTMGETTQSDASGNRWNNTQFFTDTDSNSLPLLPMNGTCQKTYFNGSTWADAAGSMFPFALLLDTAGEFTGPPLVISG